MIGHDKQTAFAGYSLIATISIQGNLLKSFHLSYKPMSTAMSVTSSCPRGGQDPV